MGFVNNQDRLVTGGVLFDQKSVQIADQRDLVLSLHGKPEVIVDHCQQLFGRDTGIKYLGEDHVFVAFVQQVPDQCGLPGADFAGKQNETGAFPDTVIKVGHGFFVRLAQVDESGVRKQVKRLDAQLEKGFIHS